MAFGQALPHTRSCATKAGLAHRQPVASSPPGERDLSRSRPIARTVCAAGPPGDASATALAIGLRPVRVCRDKRAIADPALSRYWSVHSGIGSPVRRHLNNRPRHRPDFPWLNTSGRPGGCRLFGDQPSRRAPTIRECSLSPAPVSSASSSPNLKTRPALLPEPHETRKTQRASSAVSQSH